MRGCDGGGGWCGGAFAACAMKGTARPAEANATAARSLDARRTAGDRAGWPASSLLNFTFGTSSMWSEGEERSDVATSRSGPSSEVARGPRRAAGLRPSSRPRFVARTRPWKETRAGSDPPMLSVRVLRAAAARRTRTREPTANGTTPRLASARDMAGDPSAVALGEMSNAGGSEVPNTKKVAEWRQPPSGDTRQR